MCHMKCMHVRLEFIKTIAVRRLCHAVKQTMRLSSSRKFNMKADLDNTIRSLRNCRTFYLETCLHSYRLWVVVRGKSKSIKGGFSLPARCNPRANVLIYRHHLFVLGSYKSTFPLSLTPRKFKNKPASVSEINIKLGGHVLGCFFSLFSYSAHV